MTDLTTIGTLSGGASRDLISWASGSGGPGVASVSSVLQLLLLLAGLSSSLVLLESFELLLDPACCQCMTRPIAPVLHTEDS